MIKNYSEEALDQLQLLTSMPVLYACNVLKNDAITGNKLNELVAKEAEAKRAKNVLVLSKIEADIAVLESNEEKIEFLNSIDLVETGLSKIIKEMYNLLELKNFFTVGPKETHAWTFGNGTLASKAAVIYSY